MRELGLLGRDRVLIVTAVSAERRAILRGLGLVDEESTSEDGNPPVSGPDDASTSEPIVVIAAGVGVAAAAAATARHLALAEAHGSPYQAVISAGIAGGFAERVEVGGQVLAAR